MKQYNSPFEMNDITYDRWDNGPIEMGKTINDYIAELQQQGYTVIGYSYKMLAKPSAKKNQQFPVVSGYYQIAYNIPSTQQSVCSNRN
jgi:hypothetical protein